MPGDRYISHIDRLDFRVSSAVRVSCKNIELDHGELGLLRKDVGESNTAFHGEAGWQFRVGGAIPVGEHTFFWPAGVTVGIDRFAGGSQAYIDRLIDFYRIGDSKGNGYRLSADAAVAACNSKDELVAAICVGGAGGGSRDDGGRDDGGSGIGRGGRDNGSAGIIIGGGCVVRGAGKGLGGGFCGICFSFPRHLFAVKAIQFFVEFVQETLSDRGLGQTCQYGKKQEFFHKKTFYALNN